MAAKQSSSTNQILIVEDFHAETELILAELRDAEILYNAKVVSSESEYKNALKSFDPDVILSPYSLRGTNATKLLGIARKANIDAPFILLAFDLSEDIAIELLGEGIEDYVLRSTLKRLPVSVKKALQRYRTTLQLRLSETRLKASEASMRNMVRKMPIAVAMFDNDMKYLVVSNTWLKHEKKTEQELIGNCHYDVVPEIPESWKNIHQKVLSGETHSSEKEKMVRADGSVEVLRWKMNPWYDANGSIGGAVLFTENITSLVEVQVELEKTAKSLAIAQNIAKIGSWALDTKTLSVQWSDEMFVIHGIDKRPLTFEFIRSLTHIDDLNIFDRAFETLTAGTATNIVYRIVQPNTGEARYMRGIGIIFKDTDGEIVDVSGTVQDISESINTFTQLEKDQHLLAIGEELGSSGSFEFDIASQTTRWSENMYKIKGFELTADIGNDKYIGHVHPEDKSAYLETYSKIMSSVAPTLFEYRLIRPLDGKVVHLRLDSRFIRNRQGTPTALMGSVQDITQIKETQKSLKLSEASLKIAQNIAKIGSWVLSSDGLTVEWSDEMFVIHGIEKQSVSVEIVRGLMHPDDLEIFDSSFERLVGGEETDMVYRIIIPSSKEVKWMRAIGRISKKPDGSILSMSGTVQDITESKLFERQILDKEQVFREMAENIGEVFWLTDKTGAQILYMGPLYEEVYGRSIEEVYENGDAWSENIHADDKERVFKAFREKGHLGKYDVEYRLVHADGTIKWVHARAFPIKDENGKVVRLAGITEEITEQKLDKEKIETLSLVASETGNGVLIQDSTGKIEWSNKGFSDIFGYKTKEVIGRRAWSFLRGEKTNLRLAELAYEKVKSGKSFSSENVLYTKAKEPVWMTIAVSPIFDASGKLHKMVTVGTNITKQKELEELQRTMLKKLESSVKDRTSELETINEELRAEVWEKQRISDELYHNNLDLNDSIQYAKRIQESILPKRNNMLASFSDLFVLLLPRDVVSGDFYWHYKRGPLTFFSAIDCTGHGVPGALMSMIANELMNQAVIQRKLSDPAEILSTLDKLMVKTLQQKNESLMTQDGMDVGICVFNHDTGELSFSGAFGSIYVSSKTGLQQINGSRHSIGGHLQDVTKEFETVKINLNPSDIVYMSSDGYVDQFGGPKGKKLMKKRFETFLSQASELPVSEQRNFLLERLEEWKGSLNQVDDILVTGLSFRMNGNAE